MKSAGGVKQLINALKSIFFYKFELDLFNGFHKLFFNMLSLSSINVLPLSLKVFEGKLHHPMKLANATKKHSSLVLCIAHSELG